MQEWSLRRRKVSLLWVAALQKQSMAMQALVTATADEIDRRLSDAGGMYGGESSGRWPPTHPDVPGMAVQGSVKGKGQRRSNSVAGGNASGMLQEPERLHPVQLFT